MAAKLKGFSAKRIMIDHGEKILFGLIMVLVVLGLAGTNWSPYEREPHEFLQKVADARQKIEVTTWPEEEKTAFVLTADSQPRRIVDMHINDRILVTPDYMQSQPQLKDKDARDQPLEEPEFLPVVDLMASDARVLIALAPKYDELLAADGTALPGATPGGPEGTTDPTAEEEDNRPDEFRDRGGSGFGGRGGIGAPDPAMMLGPGIGAPGMRGLMAGDRDYKSRQAPELMRRGRGGAMPGMPGMRGSAVMADRGRAGGVRGGRDRDRERDRGRASGSRTSRRGTRAPGAATAADTAGFPLGDVDPYGEMYATEPLTDGKGYPFVSVRGVFEMQEQIRRYSDAIHKGPQEAMQYFMIVDFELERQKLLAAPDQWSDWERVNDQVLRDILREADGFDIDVVDPAVTDSAITCPLPARLTGMYVEQATHPRLEKYQLSPEELDRRMEYYGLLLSEVLEQNKLPEGQIVKKGFSDMVFDARQVQQGFFGMSSPYAGAFAMGPFGGPGDVDPSRGMAGFGRGGAALRGKDAGRPDMLRGGRGAMDPALNTTIDQLAEELARRMQTADDKEAQEKENKDKLKEWILAQAGAPGDLLLFRYLDFDVEPGATYRYRVRLELQNPNYGAPIAAAAGIESVVHGATRWTPWSEPTGPITVDETVQYFLTGVDQRPRLHPLVRMNIFQYDQDVGTVVQKELDVAFGQNIGGKARVEQADPAKQLVDDVDYTFKSQDILVDALPDVRFNRQEHPGLELPTDSRGLAQVPEFAAVVTPEGQVKTIDPMTQAPALAQAKQFKEWQDEQFAYLRPETEGLEGEFAGLYEEAYGPGMAAETDMRPSSRNRRNLLRRGGGAYAGPMGGMFPEDGTRGGRGRGRGRGGRN